MTYLKEWIVAMGGGLMIEAPKAVKIGRIVKKVAINVKDSSFPYSIARRMI